MHLDTFTRRRLLKFIEDFRTRTGQLPTLRDLEAGRFTKPQIDEAIKTRTIELFYVTLTNGTIVKGYKICEPAKDLGKTP